MDVLMSWITAFLLGTSVYRVRKNAEENGDERKEDCFGGHTQTQVHVQADADTCIHLYRNTCIHTTACMHIYTHKHMHKLTEKLMQT